MLRAQLYVVPRVQAIGATPGQVLAVGIALDLPDLLPQLVEVGLVFRHLSKKKVFVRKGER